MSNQTISHRCFSRSMCITMADDLDDGWWIGTGGSDSRGSDSEDGGAALANEPPDHSSTISEPNPTSSKRSGPRSFNVEPIKKKTRNEASNKERKLGRKSESFSRKDLPFGKFNRPSNATSNELQTDLHQERKSDADEFEVKPLKKKRKRRNKTQALAECKNPVEPIKEFTDMIKAKQAEMTAVEKDEVDFSAVNVIQEPLHGKRDLSAVLLGSLARCGALLSRQAKPRGQPFILVITGSGIRSMDLKRNLQKVTPECKVAKLFAKHIKISDQVENMTNTPVQVAVGTPRRIYELIELDALKLSKLKYILLDWTWRDTKLRRMPDIAEIKQDLLSLLFKHLLAKSIKYNTQVILL